MNEMQLLACPFCGNNDIEFKATGSCIKNEKPHLIEYGRYSCSALDCCEGPIAKAAFSALDDKYLTSPAAEAWNRRAAVPNEVMRAPTEDMETIAEWVNDKEFNDMACDFMDKSVADLKAKFNQR